MDRQISLTVDGGWAWFVCAACFSIQFVVFGIIQSYGIIFIALLKEFKSGESETAWVGSLAFGFIFFNGPMTTALIGHFGYRKIACLGSLICSIALLATSFATSLSTMYVTFSLVWGLGASFSFFPSLLVLRFYFNRKLSRANGIAMAGSAAGTLLLNLAIGKMNESVGWRTSLRVLSALSAGSSFCGCTFLPPPEVCPVAKQWAQYSKVSLWKKLRRTVDVRPWRNRTFLVYLLALCFILIGYFVPYVHLVRLAETRGVSTSKGSLLVGYLSMAQIFGKLLFGRLADHRWFNEVYLLFFAGFVLSLSSACATLAQDYGGLLAFALVFGFFDGGLVVNIPLIASNIVGREQMANAFGGMYGIVSIPMTLGPPLSAALYDHTGSYSLAFYASSSFIAVGISLMYVVQRLSPSIMVRTELWPNREIVTHSLVEDNAMNIHVADTFSADALSGMCIADNISLTRERAAMELAQTDAESISLSTIFPVSRMLCDPLSRTSYSVSTQCSDATISLIVPDIHVIPPSDSASLNSETHNFTGANSLSSTQLQALGVGETRNDNEELFRAALENLARKEKETTNSQVESDSATQLHLVTSKTGSLKQQSNSTLTSPEHLSIVSTNVNTEIPKHVSKVGDKLGNAITKQPQLNTQDLQHKTSEPLIQVNSLPVGNQADDDVQLELVPVPPAPPDTPRNIVAPLVELGEPDIMLDVEHLDLSHLASTSHSIPESLLSIQESLRSRQDISVGSSMLFDHCMFTDSAQVSALSERLEAVAAHRRSLEEAEMTALLTTIDGATTNSQAVSEAEEEILQVRIPPPPSSSKRRSCTSSVSYDSPVPAVIDQILSSSSLSRNHSEGDFIFGLPEGIGSPLSNRATPFHFGVGTSENEQEKTRDVVDYLGLTKPSLKTDESGLASFERQGSESASFYAPVVENREHDETKVEQFIGLSSPQSPIFETSTTQQELRSVNDPEFQQREDVSLSIVPSNCTDAAVSTAPESTDHHILIHQEKFPSLDVFGMPNMKDIQTNDVENNISQNQQCPLREAGDDLRKSALPATVSVLPAKIKLNSLSSGDIEQIPSSTPTDEVWRKDYDLRSDTKESLLKQQSGYKGTTVPQETNADIAQTTSTIALQEVDSIADSFVVVEIMENMPLKTMSSEKVGSLTWEQINKDLELLIRQESSHAIDRRPGNQEEVFKQLQENLPTAQGTSNSPAPLHSVMESFLETSVPKDEDTTNAGDAQLHHKERLTALETGVIASPTKVDSQPNKLPVFEPLPQLPDKEETLIVNDTRESPSVLVSPEVLSESVPDAMNATAEESQAAQTQLRYPPQSKTAENKTFHSDPEQKFQSETKCNDEKNATSTIDYKENNMKGNGGLKQLRLNSIVRVFNESEDDSSADEDATSAKQEVRELVGVEPLISGSEILPKEYWRDLERARTRKGRPLSGSSSGSQSGYSTDTSFSESDNEGVNVHYVKIPELSEPEDESK